MVDAIGAVTKTAEIALQKKRYYAVVTPNENNAFNSVNWAAIESRLAYAGYWKATFRIGPIYDTEDGERNYNITAVVAQGTILSSVLWNAAYDGVLRLKLPPGVKLVGFADDIFLVYGESIVED